MITNRPRRLRTFDYLGRYRYFLTTCTFCRTPAFVEGAVVTQTLLRLRECARLFAFAPIAYCFMPDHLHVFLLGESEAADFRALVKRFKQLSGFDYRRSHSGVLWQEGFYERVLREDEGSAAIVRYILENPIRAGLTKALGQYPHAGSDRYSIAELLAGGDLRF